MISYTLATETDDADIRALLRRNGMPSWVDISLQREPSFFAGVNNITHDFAVIARDGRQVVGMYTCSLQPVYMNGEFCTLGYLGSLRVTPSYRHKIKILRGGYASIARLIPKADYPFWFTSIANDNTTARRLLEAGPSGLPNYDLIGEMHTLALPATQGRRLGQWRNATQADIPALIDFHNREAAQFQFAPLLNEAWIHHIGLEHFLIYGGASIQACVGIWDQSGFKQVVATAYRPLLQVLRPVYNSYATLTNRIRLPPAGSPLKHCFLAFAAFSEQTIEQAVDMFRDVLSRCDAETAVIGLHHEHPLLNALASLKPLVYRTQIYAVSYADKPSLDGRPVQPEVALL
ncbi:MAG: hypothetical protein R8K46_11025 [Mariprofundaceae bacterium]